MTATHGHVLDVLPTLAAGSARCCVTSPPYWGLRCYGTPDVPWPEVTLSPMAGLAPMTIPAQDASLGLEPDPWAYVGHLVSVFREVRRVLAVDGTLFLNLGDSYMGSGCGPQGESGQRAGRGFTATGVGSRRVAACGTSGKDQLKPKDLLGIPWRVAFALQADGWWLRSDVVWAKPNPMPESVTDRPTKAHEMVFLLAKSERYFFRQEATAEPLLEASIKRFNSANNGEADATKHQVLGGTYSRPVKDILMGQRGNTSRNLRSVWTIATEPCPDAHFAVMPSALAERCILAGSEVDDTVLDPFAGAGTTLATARRLGRRGIGSELNPEYIDIQERRIDKAGGWQVPLLGTVGGRTP